MVDYHKELMYTGTQIRKFREAKNLTVQELAYQTDKERSYLSKVEGGKINITYNTLCIIANALEVKLSDLVK